MTDEGIVSLYWNRDEQAITETDLKYGKYCFTIAYNILCNKEESDECVNDTYNKAWNSMPPQRPVILSAFLGKITRNISLNRYKENNAKKRGGSQLPLILDELGDIASDMPGPDDELIRKQMVQAINDFLKYLSADKRVMFIRRYWYFDSVKNICLRYGFGQSKVLVMLKRTRDKLAEYLKKEGYIV